MLFPGEFNNLQSVGSGMCLALVFRRELDWSLRQRGDDGDFLHVLRIGAAGVLGFDGTGQFRAGELSSLKDG
jgi:hypothetical protein